MGVSLMNRTDDDGVWESTDDGVTWLLTAPSEAFITQQAADPDPEPQPSPEVTAAQAISDEISSRMDEAVTIGDVKLAVTDGLLAALATLRGEA